MNSAGSKGFNLCLHTGPYAPWQRVELSFQSSLSGGQ